MWRSPEIKSLMRLFVTFFIDSSLRLFSALSSYYSNIKWYSSNFREKIYICDIIINIRTVETNKSTISFQTHMPLQRGRCDYWKGNVPYKRWKREWLHRDPDIALYYDVISEKEATHVKILASQMVSGKE